MNVETLQKLKEDFQNEREKIAADTKLAENELENQFLNGKLAGIDLLISRIDLTIHLMRNENA